MLESELAWSYIYNGKMYELVQSVFNGKRYILHLKNCSEVHLDKGDFLFYGTNVPIELIEITRLWMANSLGLRWSEFAYQALL